MFVKNIAFCVIILCLASLFVGLPFVEAHRGTQDEIDALDEAKENRDSAYAEKDKWLKRYNGAKAAVDTLLSAWDSNEQSIKDDSWDVGNTVVATVISLIMERVLTDDPGDGSATKAEWLKEVVEHLPAILTAINAGRKTASLIDGLSTREAYLLSLSSAVSALDEVISQNQSAFNAYESKYDVYVDKMQNHAGGLARVANHSSTGDYSNTPAWSLDTIKSTVKASDAYNADDSKNMLMFWYHVKDLENTSRPSSKSINRFKDFENFWKLTPLPTSKRCGGDCGQQFRTPVEHLVVCPHDLSQDAPIPAGKVKPAGCDIAYYTCKNDDINEHRIRLCRKNKDDPNNAEQKIICNEPYRNCNNSKYDHGALLSTKHSDRRGGLIVVPGSGLFGAAPGDSHTSELTALSAYTSVKWYVAGPGVTGRGSLIETDNGDGSSTTASLTYTFPSGVSGDYVITAVYADANTTEETSYTVSVSTSTTTSTPSYHACGVHETWQSGDHSLQASCSLTNANGQCSVTNFYACQSHTCVFPEPSTPEPTPTPDPTPSETCARKACGESVSDRLVHRIDCGNCNGHYWTCVSGAIHNHTTPFTCRRSGCGATFTRCSNGTCTSDSGTHTYHWAQ